MKIAIVAPSPIPFGVGGAEKLWWGMLEYINKHTTHQCELIKVPVKENNFWNLIDSYKTFYDLNLYHFDMVITTKYPAWMVQHHNHHIYLQHCLRGLYDTYHFSGLPLEHSTDHPKVSAVLQLMKSKDTSIDDIFNALFELKSDSSVPDSTYSFPGSFIRQVVHFLDNKTMQNVKSFSAISQTVVSRKEYFPNNVKVSKIYHPSNLTNFENRSYQYFFTASRLDEAKRIHMIIDAYMKSNTQIPLKIAGAGPLSDELRELTSGDSRIDLLGFVSDAELMEYYSDAYAVLFVPYDEDYGLITIEAMMCEKPVLTFSDTGGVMEFVENRVTGLICEPDVDQLAKNIEFLSNDAELCMRMGKEAKKRVEDITWEYTIASLLNRSLEASTNLPKKTDKVTVVSTYPIYPPRGGGQNRIFYLYKELAKSIMVDIVCLVDESEEYKKSEIAPNLFEVRVPKTKEHAFKERKIEEKAGIPVTDMAMLYLYDETPLFGESIKKSFVDSDYLIMTQPYTFELCKTISSAVIYDSQNIEYSLKKQMLQDTAYNQQLLKKLFDIEKLLCLEAIITMVCAMDDAVAMEKLYEFDSSKAVLVPNGVDLHSVPYASKEERHSIKQSLGLEHQKSVLFMGSWHHPNIDAVEEIFKMAMKLPHYHFIVIGGAGSYFLHHEIPTPENIGFTGLVSDKEKEVYLSIADVAINPMLTGSGTNLKMLDYMANGIPVVSTKVGARGLGIPVGYIAICDVGDFCEYIMHIDRYVDVDVEKSREYVERNFSWSTIGKNFREVLLSMQEKG